ncbi:MAG: RNA polymerase sigma-70 factor [Cytophagales bacterium]|nr:RNA polymerase sigma-70 factor [Cytophagales bacterium]
MKDLSGYSDQELFNMIKSDNFTAFNEVYSRYWEKLYCAAYRVLRDGDACKDILQEVFSDFWIRKEKISVSSLSAYLHTAVKYQVFNFLRADKISQEHLGRMGVLTSTNATEEMIDFRELEGLLERSIAQLPDRCRKVFQLSRDENLSVKEIAARLNISPKTVESQITKALRHLKMSVGETVLIILLFL